MNRTQKWITAILILIAFGTLGYYVSLNLIPRVIYRVAQKRLDIPVNQLAKPGLIDETARAVVMPNPDFIYATAFYDLSDGPLRLTGNLPADQYWSLALYEPNTVNYFVRNDLEFGQTDVDLILANRKQVKTLKAEPEIIESPGNKGFLLFRLLVSETDSLNLNRILDHQASIQLEAFSKN